MSNSDISSLKDEFSTLTIEFKKEKARSQVVDQAIAEALGAITRQMQTNHATTVKVLENLQERIENLENAVEKR